MPSVIPHSHKQRLPAGAQYPLQFSDLEACFAPFADQDVYVDAHFNVWRTFVDTPKSRIPRDGQHHLIDLTFEPNRQPAFRSPQPWDGRDDCYVVAARVYALPHAAAEEVGYRHQQLGEALATTLKRMKGAGLFRNRWELHAELWVDRRELELAWRTWDGLREGDWQHTRVPVAPAGAP
jgi:hypothetical protein